MWFPLWGNSNHTARIKQETQAASFCIRNANLFLWLCLSLLDITCLQDSIILTIPGSYTLYELDHRQSTGLQTPCPPLFSTCAQIIPTSTSLCSTASLPLIPLETLRSRSLHVKQIWRDCLGAGTNRDLSRGYQGQPKPMTAPAPPNKSPTPNSSMQSNNLSEQFQRKWEKYLKKQAHGVR